MDNIFGNRKIAFKALVGSHNYNLNDETSDRDYKFFVMPSFDDLYDSKYFSLPSQVSEELDFDVHDFRKLPQLFYKGNINFLEVLFSTEVVFIQQSNHYIDTSIGIVKGILDELFSMRDKIAQMNLPYLYHACKGMHYNKMSFLYKGTKGTMPLVKQFGYDTKQALHAYRVLDFIIRLYDCQYNFRQAMYYEGIDREFMLAIKRGAFTDKEFQLIVGEKMEKFLTLQEVYDNIATDEETHFDIKRLVKEAVKSHLTS
jgi:predicted nucleotidyltransferase